MPASEQRPDASLLCHRSTHARPETGRMGVLRNVYGLPRKPTTSVTWPGCGSFDPEKLSDPEREESAFRNWAVLRQ